MAALAVRDWEVGLVSIGWVGESFGSLIGVSWEISECLGSLNGT